MEDRANQHKIVFGEDEREQVLEDPEFDQAFEEATHKKEIYEERRELESLPATTAEGYIEKKKVLNSLNEEEKSIKDSLKGKKSEVLPKTGVVTRVPPEIAGQIQEQEATEQTPYFPDDGRQKLYGIKGICRFYFTDIKQKPFPEEKLAKDFNEWSTIRPLLKKNNFLKGPKGKPWTTPLAMETVFFEEK